MLASCLVLVIDPTKDRAQDSVLSSFGVFGAILERWIHYDILNQQIILWSHVWSGTRNTFWTVITIKITSVFENEISVYLCSSEFGLKKILSIKLTMLWRGGRTYSTILMACMERAINIPCQKWVSQRILVIVKTCMSTDINLKANINMQR